MLTDLEDTQHQQVDIKMATAREMLIQELQRRQQPAQYNQDKLQNMVADQEKIAMMDPSYRVDLNPTVGMVNLGLAPQDRIAQQEAPESTLQALRKALNYRQQLPKDDPVALLKSLASLEASDAKATQTPKLSGEDRKRLGSARFALGGIQDIRAALGAGDSIRPEMATGVMGDNAFTEARRRAVEGIGRMQSGGAINAEESKRFMELMPRYFDSAEIREKKLQVLENEIQTRMSELGVNNYSQPSVNQQPSDPNTFDPGSMSDEDLDAMIARLSKG
jgi:hypothetical protein